MAEQTFRERQLIHHGSLDICAELKDMVWDDGKGEEKLKVSPSLSPPVPCLFLSTNLPGVSFPFVFWRRDAYT